ncbi:MAG: hypothetical protein KIS76_19110 [Pyrinomonadaceae bacterium]|nr:hypothetical protein [Pyrinomonadaceae bacterium]
MGRLIAGMAAGFAAWFVIFTGADSILKRFWNAGAAEPLRTSNTQLAVKLLLIIGCSIAAGYVTAAIARDSRKSTWIVGALIVFGSLFFGLINVGSPQVFFNVAFLLAIMPFTIVGGYLNR